MINERGYCGSTDEYCGEGCNPLAGFCFGTLQKRQINLDSSNFEISAQLILYDLLSSSNSTYEYVSERIAQLRQTLNFAQSFVAAANLQRPCAPKFPASWLQMNNIPAADDQKRLDHCLNTKNMIRSGIRLAQSYKASLYEQRSFVF
jgi:hypothetical protein